MFQFQQGPTHAVANGSIQLVPKGPDSDPGPEIIASGCETIGLDFKNDPSAISANSLLFYKRHTKTMKKVMKTMTQTKESTRKTEKTVRKTKKTTRTAEKITKKTARTMK